MYGLLDQFAIVVSNEERRYLYGVALAVIGHVGVFASIVIDDDSHHGAKLLNVLDLLDEVAVASVDHDDHLVAVEGTLLQVVEIEVALHELLAAVLVLYRIMDPPAKNSMRVIMSKAPQTRPDQPLPRFPILLEFIREDRWMQHEELMCFNGQVVKYCE